MGGRRRFFLRKSRCNIGQGFSYNLMKGLGGRTWPVYSICPASPPQSLPMAADSPPASVTLRRQKRRQGPAPPMSPSSGSESSGGGESSRYSVISLSRPPSFLLQFQQSIRVSRVNPKTYFIFFAFLVSKATLNYHIRVLRITLLISLYLFNYFK